MQVKDVAEESEFFVPERGVELAPYLACEDHHSIHLLARFLWAARVRAERAPRRVLDIACGSGYGTAILARALPDAEVWGVDYDPRAFGHAMEHYSLTNGRFHIGSLTEWSFYEDPQQSREAKALPRFDAVVSFDTVEHLSHREIALMRLCEGLESTGVLLFSTPSGDPESRLLPEWSHHKIEYGTGDLIRLMGLYFEEVQAPGDRFPHIDFWRGEVNRGRERYVMRANPLICKGPLIRDGAVVRRGCFDWLGRALRRLS